MPATETLSTLVLGASVGPSDTWIKVLSTTGFPIPTGQVHPRPTGGIRLFVDGECMDGLRVDPGSMIQVVRGVDGTSARPHSAGATLYFGRPDQFYQSDPVGAPPEATHVQPWINVVNGTVWFAQGDAAPGGLTTRWWQQQTTTHDVGALGVRTAVSSPDSST